jgi:predicted Zn-dependent protease
MSKFGTAVAEALARAQEMLRTRRYAQSLQICTQALARGVDDPQLRLVAAHSLLAQSLNQRAKQEAQQVLRLDPGQAEAHRLLSDIAQAEGQVGTACEHLQCVLELDPSDEHARTVYDALSRWAGGAPGEAAAKQGVSQLSLRVTSIARFVEGFDAPDLVDVAPMAESGAEPISGSVLDQIASHDQAGREPLATTPTNIESEATRIDGDAGRDARLHDDYEVTASSDALLASSGWEPGAVAGVAKQNDGGFDATLGLPSIASDETPHPAEFGADAPTALHGAPPVALRDDSDEPFDPVSLIQSADVQEVDDEEDEEDNEGEPTRVASSPRGARPDSRDDVPQLDVGGLERVSSDGFEPIDMVSADGFESMDVEPASAPVAMSDVPSAREPVAEPAAAEFGFGAPVAAEEDPDGHPASFGSTGPSQPRSRRSGEVGTHSGRDSGMAPADPMMEMLVRDADSGMAPPADADDGWDPLADARAAGVPDHAVSPHDAALAPADSIEQELMGAPVAAAPTKKRGGGLRIFTALVVAFLLGAGGLYGFLVYRNYTYVQSEWAEVRSGLRQGTRAGLQRACDAAGRVVKKRSGNKEALAAAGMCEAVAAYEFGEARVEKAQALLKRSSGSDSEWRTVAGGFLALLDNPTLAVGYLRKGTEIYPQSALLKYLRGRALAAAGEVEAAIEAYQSASKAAPGFAAAQIELARQIGQQPEQRAQAIEMLDSLLEKKPDHVRALLARARLRAENAKALDLALADAQRVSVELKEKASAGQLGWASLLTARIARAKGDVKQMSAALDAAIASPPCCDDEFSYELAGELQSLFRFAEAREQMKLALARRPKRPSYLQRIGRVLLALGKPKQAEPYIMAAPAHEPRTKLLRGRLAFALGRLQQAESALQQAVNDKGTGLEAQVYLALTRAKAGNRGSAIAALSSLRSKHPRVDIVPQALGRVYLWEGDYGRAEAAFKSAWQLNALDPLTPTLLGYVSMERHDSTRARKRFERALRDHPSYALAHIGLAELLLRTHHIGAAQAQAQKVLEADRERLEYRVLQAHLALAQEKTAEAEAMISDLKELGASQSQLQRIKGQVALIGGKFRAAASLLTQAYRADPSNAELAVLAGRALLKARRIDDGYDLLEGALARDPGHPELLLELGRISLDDGEFQFAVQRIKKSLEQMRQRQWPKTYQAQAFTSLGQTFLARNDTGRALANLQDAIDLDPKLALPNYLMGRTHERLERPNRAIPYYKRSIEIDPSFAPSYLALGQAYLALGDPARAREQLQAFISKSTNRGAIARAQRLMQRAR